MITSTRVKRNEERMNWSLRWFRHGCYHLLSRSHSLRQRTLRLRTKTSSLGVCRMTDQWNASDVCKRCHNRALRHLGVRCCRGLWCLWCLVHFSIHYSNTPLLFSFWLLKGVLQTVFIVDIRAPIKINVEYKENELHNKSFYLFTTLCVLYSILKCKEKISFLPLPTELIM